MREVCDAAELDELSSGDVLIRWAARGLDGRSRAWASADGRAVAVAGPALSRRDRLAVAGDPVSAVPLVAAVLAEAGPAFRPVGDRALVDALVAGVPGLRMVADFGWMDRTADGGLPDGAGAAWLPRRDLPEVAELVEAGHPASYAKPGVPGVERWAGLRNGHGSLTAAGALAWSAPAVGFLAGIAVRPDARGAGLGRRITGFLLAEALRAHGTAALMVDDWNHPALRLYRALGFRYRPVRAAEVAGPTA